MDVCYAAVVNLYKEIQIIYIFFLPLLGESESNVKCHAGKKWRGVGWRVEGGGGGEIAVDVLGSPQSAADSTIHPWKKAGMMQR